MKSTARRKAEPALPAIAPPREEIHDLHGNSGARIALHTGTRGSFVRKTAGSPAANARLLAQAAKQNELGRSGVVLPRVLISGYGEDRLAFFDMEYVAGRTVADAVVHDAPFDRNALGAALQRLLWLLASCRGEELPEAQFHGKIDDIARKAAQHEHCAPLMPQILTCTKRLNGCDWSGIPQSPCHGDLTLENIMLASQRGIVFIDCDDAWVSSFWLDVGKLFQDIAGHWCIRGLYEADAPAIRRAGAVQKLERMGADFRALAAAADPVLPVRLPQLAALGLFRALPYARTSSVAGFVCARIGAVLDGRP
ncbi:MAG: phosphotransferase [Proteobacteria bacterium]|nr:phosphotransferase [Pseudomonadota bacterium]